MTLPVQQPWIDYDYQGPNEYEFPFYAYSPDDIKVSHYIEGESIVILQPGADYTVALNPDGSGKVTTTYDPRIKTALLKILRHPNNEWCFPRTPHGNITDHNNRNG